MVVAGVLMGAGAYWWNVRPYDAARLMQCLPAERSLHLYLDVAMLRNGGVLEKLAGAPTLEDPDYKQFVMDTGFNYRTDLDSVAAAFSDGNEYFVVQGRFNQAKLAAYAQSHQGRCEHTSCSMPANQPGKTISFALLRSDLLALAVAKDARGSDMIVPGNWKTPPQIPRVALWISAPPFVFSDSLKVPAGASSFLTPLAQARGTVFTLGPASNGNTFELRMEVTSASPEDASNLAKQLSTVTELLKKMLDRDKMKANPADLSGVLVAGQFQAQESRVIGVWPIDRSFLDSLVSGKVQ